ncbi:hypothetical protein SAMN04487897_11056 [Paenibacillus sp. yr247]|uniref:hypothetical protein n=1 Tax=Paenibacillus sp. yr247 TaxID=1761880 RepID=UPI0008870CE5|nr:hypothetical protein [Paenibacillus sp. yr247]SDO23070.1 hypothetical protein SAMN04487897_11056 [Paenibacillus sp. yr247]
MLYILQIGLMLVWVGWLLKSKRLSWSSFVNIYVLALLVVDFTEIILNLLLDLYKFPTHLLSDPVRDNFLGILFTDSIILPLTAVLFCYHVKNHPWKITFTYTFVMTFLEWIYLELGFLTYNYWSIVYSSLFYLVGFAVFSRLGDMYIHRPSEVPYFIRLTCFAYTALVLPGAIPDVLLNLYKWCPGLLQSPASDDRIADLGSCFIFAVIIGMVISRIATPFKIVSFALLACLTLLFVFYSYGQGWLIYNHWNHPLTIIRYLIPYQVLYWYDRWQAKSR